VPGGPGPDLVLVQGGQFPAASKPSPAFHRDPATRTSRARGTG
jgi:hypothetical protein